MLTRHVTRSSEFLTAVLGLLLPIGREHQRVCIIADEHRREVTRSLLIELLCFAYLVARTLFFPLLDLAAGVFTRFCHVTVRVGFEVKIVVLSRIFVLTLVLQHLRRMEVDGRILLLVFAPQRTLVRPRSVRVIDESITLPLPIGDVAFQLAVFLRAQTPVTLLVDICRGVILTDRELLIRPLNPLLHRAPRQTQHR